MESITIPRIATKIDNKTFARCSLLESVTVPSVITSIGENALGYNKGQRIKKFIIYGYSASAAKTYATKNNITFISLDKVELPKSDTPELNLTAGKKRFKVKYTAVANAVGFQIRYKIKGKWSVKPFNTTKSVTKTIKKLKSGKKYTVR